MGKGLRIPLKVWAGNQYSFDVGAGEEIRMVFMYGSCGAECKNFCSGEMGFCVIRTVSYRLHW
jgi:hypothetical protein